MGKKFIETERDKSKEVSNAKEQIRKSTPKTVRVKTLVIIGVLIASHIAAGLGALYAVNRYNAMIEHAVNARVAETRATVTTSNTTSKQ